MRRQLLPGLRALLVFTVMVGLVYPLSMLAIGQLVFPARANGSMVKRDGEAVGSALLGQPFAGEQYFAPRPSAAGDGYDPSSTSASNLGPLSVDLAAAVEERAAAYRDSNGLADGDAVPVDAVTASASGLDPHISIANARLQAPRVAQERGIGEDEVLALVDEHTAGRALGVLGEPGVNVLQLNLALDAESGAA